MTIRPHRARLEAAARAHGIPAAGLDDDALLAALVGADAYPSLYTLPPDAQPPYAAHVPGWLAVAVTCAECAARGSLTPAHRIYIETSRLGTWASVRCPSCDSMLYLSLRASLPLWAWRWFEEAQSAHQTHRRGTLIAPSPQWWQPSLWGEPIPASAPTPPPPLPTRVMERADMAPRLHQPITYHLTCEALFGFLYEGTPDADGCRMVSVSMPTDEARYRAALREILTLRGVDPATHPEMSAPIRASFRVPASQGMESGCWWPRADTGEEHPSTDPAEVIAGEE